GRKPHFSFGGIGEMVKRKKAGRSPAGLDIPPIKKKEARGGPLRRGLSDHGRNDGQPGVPVPVACVNGKKDIHLPGRLSKQMPIKREKYPVFIPFGSLRPVVEEGPARGVEPPFPVFSCGGPFPPPNTPRKQPALILPLPIPVERPKGV